MQQGISNGYLKFYDGIVDTGQTGPGITTGGINWNDRCFRIMGGRLVRIDSDFSVVDLGAVASGPGYATLDYSFDQLSISSGGNLYYWDNVTLQQVTDPDLGAVVDHIWIDGYFMTTDGTFLIVTELNNPTQVNPTKYGSSELDPDPINALLKLRNEAYALNRYSIEVFDNVGGNGFPFQRIDGAQITRGVVGTHACAVFLESIVFVGGGRNESISIWIANAGRSERIASREIDLCLSQYTEAQLKNILVETRVDKGHQLLLVHLPNETLVYDANSSRDFGDPVWFILSSGYERNGTGLVKKQYRARNLVYCYDRWLVGDPESEKTGYLSPETGDHWGQLVGWEINTMILYNEARGVIFHELELIGLPGRSALGVDSTLWTQYSHDGETWSQPKPRKVGKQGQRKKRLMWLNQGAMRNWRIQRFFGTSDAKLSLARLEARLEALEA